MDSLTAKALREKRAPLAGEIRRMADKANAENRDFNSEEMPNWVKVNKDYDDLTRQITLVERAEKVAGEQVEPAKASDIPGKGDTAPRKRTKGKPAAITPKHRDLALQAWVKRQCRIDPTDEEAAAAKLCGTNLGRRSLDIQLTRDYRQVRQQCRQAAIAKRSMSSLNQTAGAYTIPEGFVQNLEVALLAFANVRAVADVLRTESGQDLPWPTANDTSNKGAIIAENTAVATNVDPTFGQVVFRAYKYTSKLVLVPVELMEDSAFDLASWLGDALGMRLARIQADHFTFGTGAAQPTGIVTASTSGVTAASATAIAADELYTLKHSIDPAYRQNAEFMTHDQTLLFIKKLKDGQGHYLWQSSLALGAPDTIDGDPVNINQSMDQIATGKKSLLYGLFSKYKIRDAAGIRLRRLVERYADSDQEGFVAFMRSDANLLDAGTHPVKYLVHP